MYHNLFTLIKYTLKNIKSTFIASISVESHNNLADSQCRYYLNLSRKETGTQRQVSVQGHQAG